MRKDMKIFIRFENKARLFLICGLVICIGVSAAAQQQGPLSPEEREKKMDDFIQKEIERYELTLKLEDWQVFYVDSILNHDFRAMQEEVKALSEAKVSNLDLYTQAQDKWAEQTYISFQKFLDKNQWTKYLKQGAERDRKARQKRKEKMAKAAAKLREND